MQRHADWSTRLMAAVETATSLPFAYGLHDCCTFAAHCVDAMTGSDLTAQMQQRHPYNSEDTAYQRITEAGGMIALISQYLGAPMTNPLFAAPGDVAVAINSDGREIVGVVIGHGVVVPGQPSGVRSLPISATMTAWKV